MRFAKESLNNMQNPGERRSVGQMPYLKRHLGLSAIDRCEEAKLWAAISSLAGSLIVLPRTISNFTSNRTGVVSYFIENVQ